MQHFDIIPGLLEYQLWADENGSIYINKTKDLAPLILNPNLMVIKMWTADDGTPEDDEELL